MSKTEEMRKLMKLYEDLVSNDVNEENLNEFLGMGGKDPKTIDEMEALFNKDQKKWAAWAIKMSTSKDKPKFLNKNYSDMAIAFTHKEIDGKQLTAKFQEQLNWTKTTGKKLYHFEAIAQHIEENQPNVLAEKEISDVEEAVRNLEDLARKSKDPEVKKAAASAAEVLKKRILDR